MPGYQRGVTTLVDDGHAMVVRCDSCRRLWPVLSENLAAAGWSHDVEHDLHRCPVCAEGDPAEPPLAQSDPAI
jgi:hypothetical protein